MPYYETVIVVRPNVAAKDVDKVQAIVEKEITSAASGSGKISRREDWGLREFAYIVNKFQRGHYRLLNYEVAGSAISELDRKMRMSEDIIRHYIVRTDTLETETSVFLENIEKKKHEEETNPPPKTPQGRPHGRPQAVPRKEQSQEEAKASAKDQQSDEKSKGTEIAAKQASKGNAKEETKQEETKQEPAQSAQETKAPEQAKTQETAQEAVQEVTPEVAQESTQEVAPKE